MGRPRKLAEYLQCPQFLKPPLSPWTNTTLEKNMRSVLEIPVLQTNALQPKIQLYGEVSIWILMLLHFGIAPVWKLFCRREEFCPKHLHLDLLESNNWMSCYASPSTLSKNSFSTQLIKIIFAWCSWFSASVSLIALWYLIQFSPKCFISFSSPLTHGVEILTRPLCFITGIATFLQIQVYGRARVGRQSWLLRIESTPVRPVGFSWV